VPNRNWRSHLQLYCVVDAERVIEWTININGQEGRAILHARSAVGMVVVEWMRGATKSK
jgi:hypothetical protein